jgi:hypothetical protein
MSTAPKAASTRLQPSSDACRPRRTPPRSTAEGFDLGRDRRDAIGSTSGRDDVGAGFRQPESQRPSDAAGAADHDSRLIMQTEEPCHSGCLSRTRHGRRRAAPHGFLRLMLAGRDEVLVHRASRFVAVPRSHRPVDALMHFRGIAQSRSDAREAVCRRRS